MVIYTIERVADNKLVKLFSSIEQMDNWLKYYNTALSGGSMGEVVFKSYVIDDMTLLPDDFSQF